jgi:RNA polymerase sigma factor (sigma-70 family)
LISAEIVDGCLRADRRCQRELYVLCHSILFRVAKRYTTNDEDATEVVTSSYLKILKHVKELTKQTNPEAWIKRVGVNTAIDAYRSHRRYTQRVKLEADYSTGNMLDYLHVDENTADKHLDAQYIMDILAKLPDHTREVMNLYAIDGYGHKEIASMLQVTEETSRWHVHKARKFVTEELKKFRQASLGGHA